MSPEQPRGRSSRPTEYRTTYDNIAAYDQTHQANFNSAGDRRAYRMRSVSRDHTYRRQTHGGNLYTLINFSRNSILSPSKNQSISDPRNRRSNGRGNDDNDVVEKDVVRIEQREVTGQSRRERRRPRTNHIYHADTSDYEKRTGRRSKTRLFFTAVTAVVSIFVITKSVKPGPSLQASRTSRSSNSGSQSRDRNKSRRSSHNHRDQSYS